MKAIAIQSLLLTVTLAAPLSLIPADVAGSRGNTRVGISYSSGHGHGQSHFSTGRHGSSRYGGSHGSHHSRSYHSYHSPYYSRSSYHHRAPTYYSRYSSRYNYSKPGFSIHVNNGSWGGYYGTLPRGYTSCRVGGRTYYRYGSRYYRPYNTGYVVVSNPYLVPRSTEAVVVKSVASKYDEYPRIWVEGTEYLIDKGDIFEITGNGLVWADLPVGVVASSLPTHATSVWYKEIEYFEAGGIYFQRIPEGYRIISPPWNEEY